MNIVLSRMQKWRNHVLIWIFYVLFKTYLNVSASSVIEWGNALPVIAAQLLYLLVKVPLVYFYFYWLTRFLEKRQIYLIQAFWLLFAFGIAVVSMSIVNHTVVLPYLAQMKSEISILNLASLVYHAFNLLFVVGIAMTLNLLGRQFESQLRELALEKEKTESELRYLKGQINPHFLFNTLNNIYSLARKGSEHTADSVLKLSKLMRFMLQETSQREIPLSHEIKIIEDYIELEKLRYSSRLQVHFMCDLDNPAQPIAPLLLIHFIENAFKHGASEIDSYVDIRITITLKDSLLFAQISNPVASPNKEKDTTPIGLTNIQRQLQLIYPGHQLEINQSSERFEVTLRIQLKQ